MIEMTTTSTGPAFSVEARGIDYYLRTDFFGRYELTSQRRVLRAARMGGTVRHFKTLEEVEATVKAFRGLSLLMSATAH